MLSPRGTPAHIDKPDDDYSFTRCFCFFFLLAGAPCSLQTVSPRHVTDMGAYRPGAKLHELDLFIPLPLIQSGILRVWASREVCVCVMYVCI
jgi:hypothetical protein